jgi:hypothetical protein
MHSTHFATVARDGIVGVRTHIQYLLPRDSTIPRTPGFALNTQHAYRRTGTPLFNH